MSLTEHDGDLFASGCTSLGHGVNTHGVMGAGIAVAFARRYPEMRDEYVERCRSGELRPGGLFHWSSDEVNVLNIASQDRPGRHARLEWLVSGVGLALDSCAEAGERVLALPRIGCGIGGLRWSVVRRALDELAAGHEVALQVWTP